MLHSMSENLSSILLKNKLILEENREVYTYGIEIILTGMLTTFTILLIGILCKKFLTTLVFMVVIVSIRKYSGGYHADSYLKCYMITLLMYLGSLIFNVGVSAPIKICISFVLLLLSYVIIFLVGSLNSPKNPKTEKEMNKRKNRVRLLISLYTICAFCLLISNHYLEISFTVAYTEFMVSMLLIVKLFQRRKCK